MGKLCDKTLTRQKQENHMFKDSMENSWTCTTNSQVMHTPRKIITKPISPNSQVWKLVA